jgi:hypothetical protein
VPVQLDDPEIAALIEESKPLPANYRGLIQTKAKSGHKERELDILGASGNEFRLILRQSNFNSLDFSVILAYRPPKSSQLFRLRRYNGKSHTHTNIMEKQTFYDFHIHMATARYQQESGLREDSFAEVTGRYADFQGAIQCALDDCGFVLPDYDQAALF